LLKGLEYGQLSKLTTNHAMSMGGGGPGAAPGELRVDEATASVAFNGGGMQMRMNGEKAEYFVPSQNRAAVVAEACEQVLNPDHPARRTANQDEDFKAMLAALED